ncbi:ABC transporter permease [Heyndrickxia oleronia]|uniref:ABC transporter permease n=1 Tax=Heyndrickxia oleronia TaxID=38875 RepID=A0AAW6T529_9BACI|nr:ABC transporter permease [Heyndrickxia oleronia]MDH5163774.1 ABC transporter permease [Heyndrickxia oleronia]
MKQLIISEWERLWKRKTTWLLFIAIPILVFAAAKYYQKQNLSFTKNDPQFAVAGNFPILGLSEMLMTAFNIIILLLAAFIITDEYRTGQLRMVMIRSYSFQKVFFAKFIVMVGVLTLYLIIYFIISYLIGSLMFSRPEAYSQFYHKDSFTLLEGFIYNLKFYGVAWLTLLAMSCVLIFIATISYSTTTALGAGVGFLLLSLVFQYTLRLFQPILGNEMTTKLYFSSILAIQTEGITAMLSENAQQFSWMYYILIGYILLFGLFLFFVTRKKDNFL